MENKQGKETAEFGLWLKNQYASSAFRIYYDHGEKRIDNNVAAVKGYYGKKVSNQNHLADVDVIVASQKNEILLLIEIEEHSVSPKALLGDVLALMLCNGFTMS